MDELSNIHIVSGLGFMLALVFGAVANKTHFCSMGAISDWVNIGLKGRLGACLLSMGVAIAGAQILELTGQIDLSNSIYRSTNFNLFGYIVGGLMFGVGMTLAGGCGQRTLVRLGSGNLKSLVVFLILGLSAYMTLRGIFSIGRTEIVDPLSIDLSKQGLTEQGISAMVLPWFNIELTNGIRWLVSMLIAFIFIAGALRIKACRTSFDNVLGGIVVGLCVVGAWVITGIIGNDDFEPVPLEGLSFVAPMGDSISYLMTYTGDTISFAVAVVFGVISGSFIYSLVTRTFKIETFRLKGDMINHMVGGMLMGVGGVLSLGCTMGQGATGVSTLAVGSFIAITAIVVGCMITLRVASHRLDDRGRIASVAAGVADIVFPWRSWD